MTKKLNEEQSLAIKEFAAKHGKNWKTKLSDLWYSGQDSTQPNGHLLRQIRNHFGPSWLMKFKLEV